MPRYNVNIEGNKWACFSSIVDEFVSDILDKEEYEEWRKKEYGLANYKPAEECNQMSLAECLSTMKLNRTDKEFCNCLRDVGLIYKDEDIE